MTRRSIHLCGQDVDQPGHICAFFTSRDQEFETLVPYFKEGFDAGEQVLNVLDADRLTDHRARLSGGGIAADGRIRQNPFYVPPEIYLKQLISSRIERD